MMCYVFYKTYKILKINENKIFKKSFEKMIVV